MKRVLVALVAAAAVAAASLAPQPAEARDRSGAAVALGLFGLAAGVVIGSALQARERQRGADFYGHQGPAYLQPRYSDRGYGWRQRGYGHGHGHGYGQGYGYDRRVTVDPDDAEW